MGQQQLLLLVLSTVIVGLATVAGIQAFEQGSARANQDALTQTAVKIASDAQANLKKPAQFGGEGLDDITTDGNDDGKVSLSDLGYQTESGSIGDLSESDVYKTADGECGITTSDVNSNDKVEITCESSDSKVVVEVTSLESNGISTKTQEMKN